MRIGIIGGTGREGRGLSLRWARAGHSILIGSRDAERGRAGAEKLASRLEGGLPDGVTITGGGNSWVAGEAEIAVLAVPYGAHRPTLESLGKALAGKILIDITVPLVPPRFTEVQLPAGRSAALEAQEWLGADTRVVAALHHISSAHLGDPDHEVEGDVLVCGDDQDARDRAVALIGELGVRVLDAGPLCNAIALESFTPVLLHLTRRYKSSGCGLRITGIPE